MVPLRTEEYQATEDTLIKSTVPDLNDIYAQMQKIRDELVGDIDLTTILNLIGEKPLEKGQNLYHFSNIQHEREHIGMCLTDDTDFLRVDTDSIDYGLPIYMNTFRVVDPAGLKNHSASKLLEHINNAPTQSQQNDLLVKGVMEWRRRYDRWYEVVEPGAIKLIEHQQVDF